MANLKKKANSVDPDETSRNEPSHLNLHYLKKYLLWFPDLKGLTVCKYVKLKPDSNNFNILAIC